MAKIHLTDRFFLDLQEISIYSKKKWGESVADKYIEHIQQALNRLSIHPNLLVIKPIISERFKVYLVRKHW